MLPLSVYKGTWIHSSCVVAMHLLDRSCVIIRIFLNYYVPNIDNPSLTLGCKYLFFVRRSCLHGVAWFSYWFDNLGLTTKGNTYRCCAASSLPLWANTDVVLVDI